MKKHTPLIALSLLVCLFIYLFYRTEKTLINQVAIAMFSRENYLHLKAIVNDLLPLKEFVIYSLPEGLWVFCITITSSFFYLEIKNRQWNLVFAPLLVALIMEICQLFHFTKGRFDLMDMVSAVGFWMLAMLCTRTNSVRESLFQPFDFNTVCCMSSYFIVYLAHVVH